MTEAQRREWIEQAERIEAARATYESARAKADRAVFPFADERKAEAEAAWDAWQALERSL